MNDCYLDPLAIEKTVCIPVELYESMRGTYFIGYADGLAFGNYTSAWAMLYNPPTSGVNLHVNVWTVTDLSPVPYRAQFFFNATPPGIPLRSRYVTPANTALWPLPEPKVLLLQSANVPGDPSGGVNGFDRRGVPGTTLRQEENGKLIFPPGGNFMVYLSVPETPTSLAAARIAFGWWEEPIANDNKIS